jgi:hypothetical protein
MSERSPTPEELVKSLPDLFYVANQCSAQLLHLIRSSSGEDAVCIVVPVPADLLRARNSLIEATLMFVRKSVEFFKPKEDRDAPDNLYSYLYPGYANQRWIVGKEDYQEFHKRVGHITVRESRYGKREWPIVKLATSAQSQWIDFFTVMATSYPTDSEGAKYCADFAKRLRNESATR